MFYNLNDTGGVISAEPLVFVSQRSLHQSQLILFVRRHPVIVKILFRLFKNPHRDIGGADLLDLFLFQKHGSQFAFSASEIYNR